MSPQEFWRIVEVRKPVAKVGNLPLDEFEELAAMLKESNHGPG